MLRLEEKTTRKRAENMIVALVDGIRVGCSMGARSWVAMGYIRVAATLRLEAVVR